MKTIMFFPKAVLMNHREFYFICQSLNPLAPDGIAKACFNVATDKNDEDNETKKQLQFSFECLMHDMLESGLFEIETFKSRKKAWDALKRFKNTKEKKK